jgi:dipeptidyl-peptidase-4
VLVYDLASKRTTTLDVRDGRPFTDEVLGHYVFAMQWADDSSELRMHRTDRKQQTMEFIGCSPETSKCRRIVREEWPTGWVENRPTFRPLGDGRRFIWGSDRTGWRNYYLYDFTGRLINPITSANGFDAGIVRSMNQPVCCSTWRVTRQLSETAAPSRGPRRPRRPPHGPEVRASRDDFT